MRKSIRLAAACLLAGLALPACSAGYAEPASNERPATVEAISGSTLKKITLIEKAATRLGIKTAPVASSTVDGQEIRSVAYAALLYDPTGKTWVYTSPSRLVFVRHEVKVLRIEKGLVYFTEGPAAGIEVATVGIAELYGTEVGVGK